MFKTITILLLIIFHSFIYIVQSRPSARAGIRATFIAALDAAAPTAAKVKAGVQEATRLVAGEGVGVALCFARGNCISRIGKQRQHQTNHIKLHHFSAGTPPASAFVVAIRSDICRSRYWIPLWSRLPESNGHVSQAGVKIRNAFNMHSIGRMSTVATMATKVTNEGAMKSMDTDSLKMDRVFSILRDSMRHLASNYTLNDCVCEKDTGISTSLAITIKQSVSLLQHIFFQSNSFNFEELNKNLTRDKCLNVTRSVNMYKNDSSAPCSESDSRDNHQIDQLQLLAKTALSAIESLHELVQRADQVRSRPTRSPSVYAWKALESVISSTLDMNSSPLSETLNYGLGNPSGTTNIYKMRRLSFALARLAMGIALSIYSSNDDPATIEDGRKGPANSVRKMVASAVLPHDCMSRCQRGKDSEHRLTSTKTTRNGDGNDSSESHQNTLEAKSVYNHCHGDLDDDSADEEQLIYALARDVMLALLRLTIGTYHSMSKDQDKPSTVKFSIDLQVISKLASGFCACEQCYAEDKELAAAVADVVKWVFGRRSLSNEFWVNGFGFNRFSMPADNQDTRRILIKDTAAPTLALVAKVRPWKFVKPDALVCIAADMDLWYLAELICDATIDSVVSSTSSNFAEEKYGMVPSFAQVVAAGLLSENDAGVNLPQHSIAHDAAKAVIDKAFDYRLYRRADVFSTKYYSFGGPERYAEARFLHACDTIAKLVKKKQAPIIERQVERVDEAVARVSKDLMSPAFMTSAGEEGMAQSGGSGEGIQIQTMSEKVREFSLRRLCEANMHSTALRVAESWGMKYEHDSITMMQEVKRRKLTYLQWDDDGCPGSSESCSVLPELISAPKDLRYQFSLLENKEERTIGFDAEWGEGMAGVALFQLSTLSHSLLLDIPELTSTEEGCDALRATVGKLFSGSTRIKHVIGFCCKEDLSRLRASSSIPDCNGTDHWFPNRELVAKDLRHVIAETRLTLGGRGGMHLGLSRACEFFLGKQLDKAEQCSDWSARPLSPAQREYAALDAWACAAIHEKIVDSYNLL